VKQSTQVKEASSNKGYEVNGNAHKRQHISLKKEQVAMEKSNVSTYK